MVLAIRAAWPWGRNLLQYQDFGYNIRMDTSWTLKLHFRIQVSLFEEVDLAETSWQNWRHSGIQGIFPNQFRMSNPFYQTFPCLLFNAVILIGWIPLWILIFVTISLSPGTLRGQPAYQLSQCWNVCSTLWTWPSSTVFELSILVMFQDTQGVVFSVT